jgi:hypothetical protein
MTTSFNCRVESNCITTSNVSRRIQLAIAARFIWWCVCLIATTVSKSVVIMLSILQAEDSVVAKKHTLHHSKHAVTENLILQVVHDQPMLTVNILTEPFAPFYYRISNLRFSDWLNFNDKYPFKKLNLDMISIRVPSDVRG